MAYGYDPFGNTGYQSVNNPALYGQGGEQIASGYAPGYAPGQQAPKSGMGGANWASMIASLLGQVKNRKGPSMGESMAEGVGLDPREAPKAPKILSKNRQTAQQLGSTALGFVPVAGPILSAGANILGQSATKSAAGGYMKQLLKAKTDPQSAAYGVKLDNPYVATPKGQKRKAILEGVGAAAGGLGAGAAAGALAGSVVPGIGTIVGGLVGAGLGMLGSKKQKQRAKAQQKKALAIDARNKNKIEIAQQDEQSRQQQEAMQAQGAQGAGQPNMVNSYLAQALRPQDPTGWEARIFPPINRGY